MYYIIQATVTKKRPTGNTTTQIPTFFLDANIQGITSSEHAAQIAHGIINPTKDDTIGVSLSAYPA